MNAIVASNRVRKKRFWGIRWLPLRVALNAAGLLARLWPGRWPRRDPSTLDQPGITVGVPERGTPELLRETLDALAEACTHIAEPVQVVVVVNGADSILYRTLMDSYPTHEWQFHSQALDYSGAIAAGLRTARRAWTYLLNRDMRLEARALAELLPYRQPQVFAIASQIFFVDTSDRSNYSSTSSTRIARETTAMAPMIDGWDLR